MMLRTILVAAAMAAMPLASLPAPQADAPRAAAEPVRVLAAQAALDRGQPGQAPGAAAESPADATLDEAIASWIASLARDEAFASWADANWSRSPLGPGTHGWVVIVRGSDQKTLGYMIVAAKPGGGFVLLEYGAGGEGPFSEAVFDAVWGAEAKRARIEALYFDALHAVWKVTRGDVTAFVDAVTGAQLPVEEEDIERLSPWTGGEELPAPPLGKRSHQIDQAADPYADLNWLEMPAAPVNDWNDFLQWFKRRKSAGVYEGAAFGGQLPVPYGVAGFHWWIDENGTKQRFVALEQEGLLRYVPLAPLVKSGTFH